MKALVLAAGNGKRLSGEGKGRNKCMRVVNGRHLIQYSFESAALSGAEEIIVVVGYRAEDIINAFGVSFEDIRIRYVFQERLQGLVDAMDCAREALEGEDFILLLGDEIVCSPRLPEMVRFFHEQDLFGVCGVVQVSNRDEIRKTYSVLYDPSDYSIYRLLEKPQNPMNNFMGTGNCVFRNRMLAYIDQTPVHQVRREKELPDLIQCAVDDGNPVKLYEVGMRYVNVNTSEDIRLAESLFEESHSFLRDFEVKFIRKEYVRWSEPAPVLP
jgi:dTDP-glucose pyrophosphorylase